MTTIMYYIIIADIQATVTKIVIII